MHDNTSSDRKERASFSLASGLPSMSKNIPTRYKLNIILDVDFTDSIVPNSLLLAHCIHGVANMPLANPALVYSQVPLEWEESYRVTVVKLIHGRLEDFVSIANAWQSCKILTNDRSRAPTTKAHPQL